MLDVEATFCYLGDVLCSGGGCDSAIVARCCMAWGKFLPVITTRHLSPKIRGKVFEACVCSAMLHGRETWGLNTNDLQRLSHKEHAISTGSRAPKTETKHLQLNQLPALEGEVGLERHGLTVLRLLSVIAAWLLLTRKTEMHGEPVFNIAWCCEPHRMGHWQPPNLWMSMDGWMVCWHLQTLHHGCWSMWETPWYCVIWFILLYRCCHQIIPLDAFLFADAANRS